MYSSTSSIYFHGDWDINLNTDFIMRYYLARSKHAGSLYAVLNQLFFEIVSHRFHKRTAYIHYVFSYGWSG